LHLSIAHVCIAFVPGPDDSSIELLAQEIRAVVGVVAEKDAVVERNKLP
jgi:hypothetical protein